MIRLPVMLDTHPSDQDLNDFVRFFLSVERAYEIGRIFVLARTATNDIGRHTGKSRAFRRFRKRNNRLESSRPENDCKGRLAAAPFSDFRSRTLTVSITTSVTGHCTLTRPLSVSTVRCWREEMR
jgi:hypothetical protein